MKPRIYERVYPVHDKAFYAEWNAAHDHCQACGVHASKAPYQPHCGGVPLSTHHIIKFGRSDERCNLLRLCYRCHQLAEGASIRVDGALLPKLTIAVCLTIKQTRDAADFDATRLQQLFGRTLPDAEPIPDFIEQDYRKWRPFDVERFAETQL